MALNEAERDFAAAAMAEGMDEAVIADTIKRRRALREAATKPARPVAQKPGIVQSIMSGVNSYLPFGQEIEAAARSLPVIGTGKGYSANYGDIQSEHAAASQAHPVLVGAGQTAAGVGGLMAGRVPLPVSPATQAALPVVTGAAQGAASGASSAAARGESPLSGAAQGGAVGAAIPTALSGLSTLASGAIRGKIGQDAMRRSDERIVDDITDGARAQTRRAINKDEADVVRTIRANPELERAARNPRQLSEAAQKQLSGNAAVKDEVYQNISVDPRELVSAARQRQEQLASRLDTSDVAEELEPRIRQLERFAERKGAKRIKLQPLEPAGSESAMDEFGQPYSDTPQPETRRSALARQLRERYGDIPGITDQAAPGVRSETSEAATVVSGRGKPGPAAVDEPVGVGGRELRQRATNHVIAGENVVPGTKPTASQHADREMASVLRDVLHGKVPDPDTLQTIKDLDATDTLLSRIKGAADYKAANSRTGNQARLTVHGQNVAKRLMHGVSAGAIGAGLASGHGLTGLAAGAATELASAHGRDVARAADEHLARLARAAMAGDKGGVQAAAKTAQKAGVRPALIAALLAKLGTERPEN